MKVRISRKYNGNIMLPGQQRAMNRFNPVVTLSDEDAESVVVKNLLKKQVIEKVEAEVEPKIVKKEVVKEEEPVKAKEVVSETKMSSWDGRSKELLGKNKSKEKTLEQMNSKQLKKDAIIQVPEATTKKSGKTKKASKKKDTGPLITKEPEDPKFVYNNEPKEVIFVDEEQQDERDIANQNGETE